MFPEVRKRVDGRGSGSIDGHSFTICRLSETDTRKIRNGNSENDDKTKRDNSG